MSQAFSISRFLRISLYKYNNPIFSLSLSLSTSTKSSPTSHTLSMDWFNNRESKNKKNKDSKSSNIMNDNNTKKKKNRFLSCFRPDSMEGFLFPKLLSPPLTLVKKEEQEKVGGGGRKKHRNARLSRILKAIFTGTFLASTLIF